MKRLFFTSLLCLSSLLSFGQYNTPQNNIWIFGNNAGLNFNTGVPVPFVSSMLTGAGAFPEGSAHVCNASGDLLFYTNGRTVYNRAGGVMLNGDSLQAFLTFSTVHAAQIVPDIANSNRYYIFSLQQYESYGGLPTWKGRLAYSIVDMTLDGGLGAVLPSASGILIDSLLCEKMVVIPGSNCNMWVITHENNSADFHAHSVSSAGVAAPVVSTTGDCSIGVGCHHGGGIQASNNGLMIVTAGAGGGTELHDFDPATGVVSNSRQINPAISYAYEFSPDDSKLYLREVGGGSTLVQQDISLATTAAILASRVALATYPLGTARGIKLGPNGKIYTIANDIHYLDVINNPNAAGTACGYVSNAVYLSPSTYAIAGLPSTYYNYRLSISGARAICIGSSLTLTPSIAGGTWTSSAPSVATVSAGGIVTGIAAGTASISYSQGGCTAVATIQVITEPVITGLTTACAGYTTTLGSIGFGGTWGGGATGIATVNPLTGVVTGLAVGSAVISYTLGAGCPFAVSTVNIISALPAISTPLPFVCIGETMTLSNAVAGGIWSSGLPTASIIATSGLVTGLSTGMATFTYTLGGGCVATTAIMVNSLPVASPISGPSTVCEGDTISLASATTGGVWGAVNANATVSTAGIVTGVAAGFDSVFYYVSNTCGADTEFYNILVYSTEYCDSIATLKAEDINNNISGVSLYPNPGTGLYDLQFSVPQTEEIDIVIYSVTGKRLGQFSGLSNTVNKVDISHLPTGVYLMFVHTNSGICTVKVLKE